MPRGDAAPSARQPLARRFAEAFPPAYRGTTSHRPPAPPTPTGAGSAGAQATAGGELYRPGAEPGQLRLKVFSTAKDGPVRFAAPARTHGRACSTSIPTASSPAACGSTTSGCRCPATGGLAGARTLGAPCSAGLGRRGVESDALNQLVLVTALDARGITLLRAHTRYFRPDRPALQPGLHRGGPEPAPGHRRTPGGPVPRALRARPPGRSRPGSGHLTPPPSRPDLARSSRWTTTASCASTWPPPGHRAHQCLAHRHRRAPRVLAVLQAARRAVPGMPEPRPLHEIWVYAPRFEGVHLRFGPVGGGLALVRPARGLPHRDPGLVKAQQVKNTGDRAGRLQGRLRAQARRPACAEALAG